MLFERASGPGKCGFALAVLIVCTQLSAQESLTVAHQVTLAELFTPQEAAALAKTLPADRVVKFRVRRPDAAAVPGVFVFISANDSGELPPAWAPLLEEKQLVWVAADGYGNARPTAERMLVAIMASKLAQRLGEVDTRRQYVSGMSGGARVASQCITHFPQLYGGAVFMVGADFYQPTDSEALRILASRRVVFLTGSGDFNRREMKSVAGRYAKAGVTQLLLMDEPGFGHELATAGQLERAIEFLDAR